MPFSPFPLRCLKFSTMNQGASMAGPFSGWISYQTFPSSGFRFGVTRPGFRMSSRVICPSPSGIISA